MKADIANKEKVEKAPRKGARMGVLAKLLCCILIPLVIVLGVFGIILNGSTAKDVMTLQDENLQLGCNYSAVQVESFFNKVYGVAETQAANPVIVSGLQNWQTGTFEDSETAAALKKEMIDVQQAHQENIINLCLTASITIRLHKVKRPV